MPCRTTGYYIDLLIFVQILITDLHLLKIDPAVFYNGIECIPDSFWLLMDLFHHKMLKSCLLCSLCIPFDLGCLLLNLITIQIIKMRFSWCQFRKLQIADIVYISGVFQDCRHIRCHISLPVSDTDDHGTVFSCYPDLARIITEHKFQCIGTTYTHHGLCDCIDGS